MPRAPCAADSQCERQEEDDADSAEPAASASAASGELHSLFINGELQCQLKHAHTPGKAGSPVEAAAAPLGAPLGHLQVGACDGRLAEVAVWRFALSPAEASCVYSSGVAFTAAHHASRASLLSSRRAFEIGSAEHMSLPAGFAVVGESSFVQTEVELPEPTDAEAKPAQQPEQDSKRRSDSDAGGEGDEGDEGDQGDADDETDEKKATSKPESKQEVKEDKKSATASAPVAAKQSTRLIVFLFVCGP